MGPVIAHLLGRLLLPFGAVFLPPAVVDFLHGDVAHGAAFLGCGAFTALLGLLLGRAPAPGKDVGRLEALVAVAALWLVAAALGAAPYLLQGLGPADAYFESMSGFTGTGASVFGASEWSSLSRGLLFWRCFSQWLGGLGIIVLFIAVLPALAVAGRQMFFAEASGVEDEALAPRVRFAAKRLWAVYVALTLLEITCLLVLGGLDLYDAACHTFSTLAAGGFSPRPRGAEELGYLPQWIILPFMFLAGTSFNLQYRSWRRPWRLFRDGEFRAYFFLVLGAGLAVSVLLTPDHGPGDALRHGFFQVVSVLTATGFASEDFVQWDRSALMILGGLMFIGGCAGSAGGGPKVIRIMLLVKYVLRELVFVIHPRAVKPLRLRGRAVEPENVRQVIGFLLSYFGVFALVALAVGVAEHDLVIGVTGSITTLGNIGPGFGATIGPMGSFHGLTLLSKLLLTFNMWVGRLEVMGVLILFHPDVLRALRPGARRRS